MEKITVLGLFLKYKDWVKKGEIQFLSKNQNWQKDVISIVEELIWDFRKATEKGGELSENLDWAETHEKGRELWGKLISCALNDIDKNSKGNSELLKFMEAATKFEDLLYGLEDYYRDHTLHSIWVYLIGEYILREKIPSIYNELNWYLYNDIEKEKSLYSPKLLKEAGQKEKDIYNNVNEKKDAIWCIIALCHDLGYSLAKLEKLNEKAEEVLKYFDIPRIKRIGFSLDIEHQPLITQFLELMAMDVRIVTSIDQKEVLLKCYRDDSTFWRLCRASEKMQHGILSSYLIYKMLGIFADTWVRGPAEEWGLENIEAEENIIRGDILFAIAQHEFDYAHLYMLSSLADILVIADELEEFSRYGRQLLSRKYFDTMADSSLSLSKSNPKQGDDIEINFVYEVAKNRSLGKFFILKAIRLCKMYSLDQDPTEHGKYCTIKRISLITKKEDKRLEFYLSRNSEETKGYLPKASIDGVLYNEDYHKLRCQDDEILFLDKKGKEISIDKWFTNFEDKWWKDDYKL